MGSKCRLDVRRYLGVLLSPWNVDSLRWYIFLGQAKLCINNKMQSSRYFGLSLHSASEIAWEDTCIIVYIRMVKCISMMTQNSPSGCNNENKCNSTTPFEKRQSCQSKLHNWLLGHQVYDTHKTVIFIIVILPSTHYPSISRTSLFSDLCLFLLIWISSKIFFISMYRFPRFVPDISFPNNIGEFISSVSFTLSMERMYVVLGTNISRTISLLQTDLQVHVQLYNYLSFFATWFNIHSQLNSCHLAIIKDIAQNSTN